MYVRQIGVVISAGVDQPAASVASVERRGFLGAYSRRVETLRVGRSSYACSCYSARPTLRQETKMDPDVWRARRSMDHVCARRDGLRVVCTYASESTYLVLTPCLFIVHIERVFDHIGLDADGSDCTLLVQSRGVQCRMAPSFREYSYILVHRQ